MKAPRKTFTKQTSQSKGKGKVVEKLRVEIDEVLDTVSLDGHEVKTILAKYLICPVCEARLKTGALFEEHVESLHSDEYVGYSDRTRSRDAHKHRKHRVDMDHLFEAMWLDGHEVETIEDKYLVCPIWCGL